VAWLGAWGDIIGPGILTGCIPGRRPVLGSIRASEAAMTGDLAGGPVIGMTADGRPGTGTRCLAAWVAASSASCFACSRISLIFCSVSADSSSDSLDFPPVGRRILGDLGDFAAVGLATAALTVGDNFSSVDSLSVAMGDGTVGSCIGRSGSGFCC